MRKSNAYAQTLLLFNEVILRVLTSNGLKIFINITGIIWCLLLLTICINQIGESDWCSGHNSHLPPLYKPVCTRTWAEICRSKSESEFEDFPTRLLRFFPIAKLTSSN